MKPLWMIHIYTIFKHAKLWGGDVLQFNPGKIFGSFINLWKLTNGCLETPYLVYLWPWFGGLFFENVTNMDVVCDQEHE